MKTFYLIIIIIITLIFFTENVRAESKKGPSIAVIKFKAYSNADENFTGIIGESIMLYLKQYTKYNIIDRKFIEYLDIEKKLTQQAFEKPDYYISGSFGKVDDKAYRLSVQVNMGGSSVVYADYETFKEIADYEFIVKKLMKRVMEKLEIFIMTKDTTSENMPPFFLISMNFLYFMPLHEFKSSCNYGLGGLLKVAIEKNYMEFGISSGIFNFSGKIKSDDTLRFIPFLLCLKYRLVFFNLLYIAPEIAGGPSIMMVKGFEKGNSITQKIILSGGGSVGLIIRNSIFVDFATSYFYFAERSVNFDCLNFNLGISFVL